MHLPDTQMEVRRRTESDGGAFVVANSNFNGFELRLAPTVMTHCQMLAEVYALGKNRIAMLTHYYPLEAVGNAAKPAEQPELKPIKTRSSLQFSASCNFKSGTVLFLKSEQEIAEINESRTFERRGSRPATADTFRLPAISLWTAYKTTRESESMARAKTSCQVFVVSYT